MAPSARYWLGTDDLGRDILSRIIFGARVSLMVGTIAIGIAAVAGVSLGLAAGFLAVIRSDHKSLHGERRGVDDRYAPRSDRSGLC